MLGSLAAIPPAPTWRPWPAGSLCAAGMTLAHEGLPAMVSCGAHHRDLDPQGRLHARGRRPGLLLGHHPGHHDPQQGGGHHRQGGGYPAGPRIFGPRSGPEDLHEGFRLPIQLPNWPASRGTPPGLTGWTRPPAWPGKVLGSAPDAELVTAGRGAEAALPMAPLRPRRDAAVLQTMKRPKSLWATSAPGETIPRPMSAAPPPLSGTPTSNAWKTP
jgi:hypothetical protein